MRNKQTLVTNALELGVIYKLHFKLFCHIFVSNEHQHWNRLPVIVDMALNKERQNSAITDNTQKLCSNQFLFYLAIKKNREIKKKLENAYLKIKL